MAPGVWRARPDKAVVACGEAKILQATNTIIESFERPDHLSSVIALLPYGLAGVLRTRGRSAVASSPWAANLDAGRSGQTEVRVEGSKGERKGNGKGEGGDSRILEDSWTKLERGSLPQGCPCRCHDDLPPAGRRRGRRQWLRRLAVRNNDGAILERERWRRWRGTGGRVFRLQNDTERSIQP